MSRVGTTDNAANASAMQAFDPWKACSATVKRVRVEAPQVLTYDLLIDDPATAAGYRFAPGQFNMLYVPGVGEAAISIAGRSADGRCLQHTIRTVGAVTGTIEAAGVGLSLGLRGPFGTQWPIDQISQGVARDAATTKKDVVIAAGGIGLAPLRALVEHLAQNRDAFGAVSVLIGVRTPSDMLYRNDYAEWQAMGIDVQTTVDRPDPQWHGHVGVVTLLLERLALANPQSTYVMTCGPEVMMRYVARAATGRAIPEENIWVTLERNMNCAIGLCGHCQLGGEFICKDGPVFRYDRVRDSLRVQGF